MQLFNQPEVQWVAGVTRMSDRMYREFAAAHRERAVSNAKFVSIEVGNTTRQQDAGQATKKKGCEKRKEKKSGRTTMTTEIDSDDDEVPTLQFDY